ncbi:MAG: hypothetical protein ACOYEP_08665 [Limnochordia bacterium]|mgnify:CR=1 FL=1|jgi:hypothetical protein
MHRIVLSTALTLILLTGGCSRQPVAVLRSLLGLQVGNRFEYVGEGNEYAAFTAQVSHAQGNRYQILEATGGTVLARIIELRPDGAYEIFTQEEHYSGENLLSSPALIQRDKAKDRKLLPWPLRADTEWKLPGDADATLVTAKATHTVPAGEFRHVAHVRVTFAPQVPTDRVATTDFFYAPGVGLLERRFTQDHFTVTSRLYRTGRAGR